MLSYYKIEKTKEGEQFFFNNVGYFNFWDEYLVMNTGTFSMAEHIYWIIVNRTGYKPSKKAKPSVVHCLFANCLLEKSVMEQRPEQMFIDFPEINEKICHE